MVKKTLLARDVRTVFINGKPAVINGLSKFKSRPSRQVIFLAVPFSKVLLFSKDLITFTMSFISLFVRVIPEHLLDANFLLSSFIPLLI